MQGRVLVIMVATLFAVLIPTGAMAYNPSAAVKYADDWWNKTNSGPPNYYTRFSANDCTNYISQALRAGSLAPISNYPSPNASYGQKQADPRNWFWDAQSAIFTQYTYSWTSAHYLVQHAYSYIGHRFQPVSLFANLNAGDFFMMDINGDQQTAATHGRFVVGYGTDSEDGQYGLLINQHSLDRQRIRYSKYWDYLTAPSWKIRVL